MLYAKCMMHMCRANAFGLEPGQVVVQIHCGSRGLGHEVCGHYLRQLQDSREAYGFDLPDRELVAAPIQSPDGQGLFSCNGSSSELCFCQPAGIGCYGPAIL